MNKLPAWFRIIRPPIVIISCLGALVGALNVSAFINDEIIKISFIQLLMIIFGAAFLSAGLMIHNDVTDLKSDKVNRPHKPLPSGTIKVKTAQITGLVFMILSIFIALLVNINDTGLLNWKCGILTLSIVIVGVCYNHYGKFHGIFGNILVAYGVGSIPYWGAIAIAPEPQHLLLMLPLALAIFTQEIGREVMVNTGDYNGDLKAGFKTLPVLVGRKKAMGIALIFYLAFIPIFPIPYFGWIGAEKVFGPIYLIGATIYALALLTTWILTYRVVLQDNEKKIWRAFELYERTGTRIMVLFFQIMLFLEAFY
jgi:geranylgeranylglycerol-phosphate geranylgeranyltransferase